MIAVIYTDGQLDLKAIAEECQANKWVPVLATKPKTDPDATGTVLLFHRVEDAQKFIVMNILSDPDKKDWLFGIIDLPDEDVMEIRKKFAVEEQSYPRRMRTHPTLDLSFEIIEVGEVPDLHVSKKGLSTVK